MRSRFNAQTCCIRALALASAVSACSSGSPRDHVDAGPAVLGSVDTDAAKAPPPLRAPHPTAPPLPDLPALAQHVAPAKKPAEISITLFGHCKGVWDGEKISATGCGTAKLLGNGGEGASPLVSWKTLRTPEAGLPSVVDHRAEGTEGVVRNQGSAPACTAFSAAAAIDHAISRWLGKASHVSVMQLWSRYHTPFEDTTVSTNLEKTLGAEEDWPFDAKTATLMLPCDPGAKAGTCGAQPDSKKSAVTTQKSVATFTRAHKIADTQTQTIELALASGQDVVVTIELPEAFVPAGKPGARYIPHYTTTSPNAGHALVVAGYAAFKDGTYFLLHNSWGTTWGDAGYAWMHEATLTAHTTDAIVIDAEPLTYDGALRPKRQRGEVTCAGALVPDSIRGTCAALCPDGSPRHDAVCPAAKSPCPTGYVNLTGACVRAAPTAKGTDTESNVSFQCGPGGCSYLVPRALDPACTGAVCKASCPAPDFRLAKDTSGLTCIQ